MLKQSIGMTESDARQIAEMYLSRYNPTYWDGSGEVPSEANFDICRVTVDSMYEGCTLEIQLCKPDACPCYAASIHLFEGGFWTGFWSWQLQQNGALLRYGLSFCSGKRYHAYLRNL